MSIIPFPATSFPLSRPQVYFIDHMLPHIANSCTTSYQPPTLCSIWNLFLFTYRATYLCGCNLSTLILNQNWVLTLPNRSLLTTLFLLSVSEEEKLFSLSLICCHPQWSIWDFLLHPFCSLYTTPYTHPSIFLNSTKHGCYCWRCHNFNSYSLLFLTLLSISDPLTYARTSTNHALVKDEKQLNASIKEHHLQVSISKIKVNHPNSQTTRDTPPAIVQSSTPVIKYINNKPSFL